MIRWQELTSSDLSQKELARWLVIWPVASLEQHGPHLPLGTDTIVLEAIIQGVRHQLGPGFPALLLPVMPLGKSPEHLSYPGTVSLQTSTLLAIVEDIASSLASHGFRRLVFLNGHGGNTALLRAIGPDLRLKYGSFVYHIDWWADSFFDEIIAELFPALAGTEVHAASIETSLLLHLRPDLVKPLPTTADLGTDLHQIRERFTSPAAWGWVTQDFGDLGVIGDPSLASAKAGERILVFAIDRVCCMLETIRDMDWGND
ncbi:MAG: creatininase family protein [Anaerolineae bacterium]